MKHGAWLGAALLYLAFCIGASVGALVTHHTLAKRHAAQLQQLQEDCEAAIQAAHFWQNTVRGLVEGRPSLGD